MAYPSIYNIAIALGGEAMPPVTFKGALVNRKLHFRTFAQTRLSSSRSHSSPIGVPQWTRSQSCKQHSFTGHDSNPCPSPPTAAKCFEYSQRTISISLETPMMRGLPWSASTRSAVLALLMSVSFFFYFVAPGLPNSCPGVVHTYASGSYPFS